MELTIIGLLALAVILGCVTVSWGVRQFNLPASAIAVAFALTAVFWLAFLIAAIGITVKTIALA
ncbi:MAG: hypothetical protein DIU80_009005 [Chloroflexota bacterium]